MIFYHILQSGKRKREFLGIVDVIEGGYRLSGEIVPQGAKNEGEPSFSQLGSFMRLHSVHDFHPC